ncbi:hypothetical protein [Noviherbaspirillum aerium]|uniref:hypothetical protein n=1 Tax=Noviherbaspirillum aerium TaxID=2588497 RepID=UPI00124F6C83|nr:hypothetical protein [Noviherbaspirillum aerium]
MALKLPSFFGTRPSLEERTREAAAAISEQIKPALKDIDESRKKNFPGAENWGAASAHMQIKSGQVLNGAAKHSMQTQLLAKAVDLASPSKAMKEARYLKLRNRLALEVNEQLTLEKLRDTRLELEVIHEKLSALGMPNLPLPKLPSPYDYAFHRLVSTADYEHARESWNRRLPGNDAEQIRKLSERFAALNREYLMLDLETPSGFLVEAAANKSDLQHLAEFRDRIAAYAIAQAIKDREPVEGAGIYRLPEFFKPHLDWYLGSHHYERACYALESELSRTGPDPQAQLRLLQRHHRKYSRTARRLSDDRRVKLSEKLAELKANRPSIKMKAGEKPAGIWQRDRWGAVSPKELQARRTVYRHRHDELKHAYDTLEKCEKKLIRLQKLVEREAEPTREAVGRWQAMLTRIAESLGIGSSAQAADTPAGPHSSLLETQRHATHRNVTKLLAQVREWKSQIELPPGLDAEMPSSANGGVLSGIAKQIRETRFADGTTVGAAIKSATSALRVMHRFPWTVKVLLDSAEWVDGKINPESSATGSAEPQTVRTRRTS